MDGMRNLQVALVGLFLLVGDPIKAEDADDSLNFLVIGDWGGLPDWPYTTDIEKGTAKGMGQIASANNVQFILALGDNFYYDGVKDVDDRRFKDTYDHVFTSKYLAVNWYIVAGNHDHRGNVSAEIAYSKVEKRWNFPALYYPLQFSLPSGLAKVDILMLDTILLCGNSDDVEVGQQPSGPEDSWVASKQWAWLEDQLKNSKAEFLLVAGHYPVFSIGEHGPTKCLVKQLLPLLHAYNVSAYFCGHDHDLQHLQYTYKGSTVDYFITGSANFIDNSTAHKSSVPPGSSKFHWADVGTFGGFGFVKLTRKQLSFSFYEAGGKLLYEHAVNPRVF